MSELIPLPDGCFAGVTMSLARTVGRSTSPFTLETQSFLWSGEAWSISFNLPSVVGRANASKWLAFAAKMKGSYNYFLMGDPMGKKPMGVASGTPVVSEAGQLGNVLKTDGWTPSINGILLAGDYIQYGTGINSRLHMVVEDVNSNPSGEASITIQPALRYSPALNSAVIVNNPRGVFRMSDNTFSWSVSAGGVYRISFNADEVINA